MTDASPPDALPPDATILHPAHVYWRAPPNMAGCWCDDANLLSYFYGIVRDREAHCPAEYMAPFARAYVYGGQHVLTVERTWFAPSILDFPLAEAQLPGLAHRIAARDVRPLPAQGKPTVMIAKAGAGNYGHVLVEILPRLINLWRSPLRTVRLLLPQVMAPYAPTVQSLCAMLGIAAELLFVAEHEITEVEHLVYLGPVSRHNTRKSETLLHFRDLLWRSLNIVPAPARRLYIERPAHEQRNLSNAAEARAVLEAAGYETVYPASMPFNDQVRLFSQASHIVGTLGAGLTNSLFAAASCRVTMIDPGLADYFFWDLATVCSQRFTWLFTGPVSFYSQELASSTYAVDLDGLRYTLRNLS